MIAGVGANIAIVMNSYTPEWIRIAASCLMMGELVGGAVRALRERKGVE